MADEAARMDSSANVEPMELLRAMMHISPEDAEKVRDRTSPTRERRRSRTMDDHDGTR